MYGSREGNTHVLLKLFVGSPYQPFHVPEGGREDTCCVHGVPRSSFSLEASCELMGKENVMTETNKQNTCKTNDMLEISLWRHTRQVLRRWLEF